MTTNYNLFEELFYRKILLEQPEHRTTDQFRIQFTDQEIQENFSTLQAFLAPLYHYQSLIVCSENGTRSASLVQCVQKDSDGYLVEISSWVLSLYKDRVGSCCLLESSPFLGGESFEWKLYRQFCLHLGEGMMRLTPDDIRRMSDTRYNSTRLRTRVIDVALEKIGQLFRQGYLQVCGTLRLNKSVMGKGRRVLSYEFEITDKISHYQAHLLYQKNLEEVKELVNTYMGIYAPIVLYQIDCMKDSDKIYHLVRELRTAMHAACNFSERFTELSNILIFHFGIRITSIPSEKGMFQDPLACAQKTTVIL